MIQGVVFDLDGTLADTAHITDNVRLPAHVLNLVQPWDLNSNLLMHMDLKRQIHWLISSGIKVHVITRAPKSYASTLIFLLGIDFQSLIPHNRKFKTVESKLHYIIESEGLEPSEVLYIGNEHSDELAARNIGTYYQKINEVFNQPQKHSNHLQNLVSLCETAEDSKSQSARIINDKQNTNIETANMVLETIQARAEMPGFNPSKALDKMIEANIFISNPLKSEFLKSEILKPFINPSFISRYEYDSNLEIRKKLLNFIAALGFAGEIIETPFKIPLDISCNKITVYSHYKYEDVADWWAEIKNWSWPHSGPKPAMLYLEFIALTMAAAIHEIDYPVVIVPIPSSDFSQDKPSETSIRLAYRIAQLSDLPILNLFKKDLDDNIYCKFSKSKIDRTVLLLDDQLTKGDSAVKCLKLLSDMGVQNVRLHTWTSKFFNSARDY